MGILSSKSLSLSDPSKFATKLDEHRPELVEAYKEYDYVIVGAGGLPFVARLFLTKQNAEPRRRLRCCSSQQAIGRS